VVTVKICVDYDKCAGHAVCESLDAEVFRLGEDGYIRLLIERPGDDKRDVIEDAVAECPTGALSIQE
jgi:ferredoxin